MSKSSRLKTMRCGKKPRTNYGTDYEADYGGGRKNPQRHKGEGFTKSGWRTTQEAMITAIKPASVPERLMDMLTNNSLRR